MGEIYFSHLTVVEFDEFDVQAHCTFPFDRVDNITTVRECQYVREIYFNHMTTVVNMG